MNDQNKSAPVLPQQATNSVALTTQTFNGLAEVVITENLGMIGSNKMKREFVRKKLELLKYALAEGLELGKVEVSRSKEIAITRVNVSADIMITDIKKRYTDWLTKEGFKDKAGSIEALNEFSRTIRELKEKIDHGSAEPEHKKLLKKAADSTWKELFETLFRSVAIEANERADAEIKDGG